MPTVTSSAAVKILGPLKRKAESSVEPRKALKVSKDTVEEYGDLLPGEEEADDVDDVEDSDSDSEAEKEAEKKVSKAKAYRDKYFPNLKDKPRDEYIKDQGIRNVASFVAIDGQSCGVVNAGPQEQLDLKGSTMRGVRGILASRSQQAREISDSKAASVFSRKKQGMLKNIDVEDWMRRLSEGMTDSTAAALGRSKLSLESLDEMSGFNEATLSGFAVYLGVVVFKDGTSMGYVGKSTNSNGSGARVIGDYERGLRYKEKGYFHGPMAGGFGSWLLQPNIEKAWLRPLWSLPHSEDSEEHQDRVQTTEMFEGVFSDYLKAVLHEGGVQEINGVEIQKDVMVEYLKAVEIQHLEVPWTRINKISPWAQGFSGEGGGCGPTKKHMNALAEIKEQGSPFCPYCSTPMTREAGSTKTRSLTGRNPLVGKVPGVTQKRVCRKCHLFLAGKFEGRKGGKNPGGSTWYPSEIPKSAEELRELIQQNLRWLERKRVAESSGNKRPFRPAKAKPEKKGSETISEMKISEEGDVGDSCLLCKQSWHPEFATMSVAEAKKIKARLPARNSTGWPCLEGVKKICTRCCTWARTGLGEKYEQSKSLKRKMFDELNEGCTLERARELRKEFRFRGEVL